MLPTMIRPALARLGAAASDDDEIIQRVRVSLFTQTGERGPGIAGYSARGDLRGYLRAIAATSVMSSPHPTTTPRCSRCYRRMETRPSYRCSRRAIATT
jgi:hypothetical protein